MGESQGISRLEKIDESGVGRCSFSRFIIGLVSSSDWISMIMVDSFTLLQVNRGSKSEPEQTLAGFLYRKVICHRIIEQNKSRQPCNLGILCTCITHVA